MWLDFNDSCTIVTTTCKYLHTNVKWILPHHPYYDAALTCTRRMAIANWTCVSWVAYATGTIAVNVTWIKREFNACQTPRSMYPFIFKHFWDIAIYRWRVTGFQQYSWANERFLTTFCFPLDTPLGQLR